MTETRNNRRGTSESMTLAVVVKAIIVRDGRILLLQRKSVDRRVPADGWETPGGHVEHGETLTDALLREIREETGFTNCVVTIPIHAVLFADIQPPLLSVVYLVDCVDATGCRLSDEHGRCDWTKLEDALRLVGTKGLKQELRAYISWMKQIESYKDDGGWISDRVTVAA